MKWWVVLAGAAVGGIAGFAWASETGMWLVEQAKAWKPWCGVMAGALAGGGLTVLWIWARQQSFLAWITSIKVKLPGKPEVEVTLGGNAKPLLLRFFFELTTRIATRPLDDGSGNLREALNSLYKLFTIARDELGGQPAVTGPLVHRIGAQEYALGILNQDLRPFLARWHPRLTAWKRIGLSKDDGVAPEAPSLGLAPARVQNRQGRAVGEQLGRRQHRGGQKRRLGQSYRLRSLAVSDPCCMERV